MCGKRERDMVGNWHTVKHSKSEWIIVDDTHEGIVFKELFQKAASRMREYKEFPPIVSERNPLRKNGLRCLQSRHEPVEYQERKVPLSHFPSWN